MRSVAVLLLVVIAACGDDAISVAPEANPLGSTDNILPYPSSLYENADGSLDVPVGAFPTHAITKMPLDVAPLAKRRGWPATTTILWAAPGGVDATGLPGPDDLASTVGGSATTMIVDMTTGERVAHFAEVDANELDNFSRQAVFLRPARRLIGGHRYAVGIHKGLRSRDGSELQRTAGFQAVLDDKDTGHARLDAARPRLREAADAIEAAGIPRPDLLVAWDFTVTPDEHAVADPLAARAAALGAMGELGANLAYTVTDDLGAFDNDTRIARRIELDFQSPAVTGEAHAGFHRDASGTVIAMGTMTANAFIMVPPCATPQNKAGVVIYGHGFFGSLAELRSATYMRDIANEGCLIIAGTQWTGMSNDDIPNALLALNDLNKGWGFGERIFQGMINTIALEQLLRGKLATELLTGAGGASIVDTSRMYFLGISLGHVLGATFFAYDPFIMRAVMHVGAANWALMFERSSNWAVYGVPLKNTYDTLLEAVIMEQVLQMALEIVDGATVAGVDLDLLDQTVNTPGKQILMHTSRNDTQVPNLASYFHARSLDVALLDGSAVVPYPFTATVGAISPAGETAATNGWLIINENPTPEPPATNEVFAYTNDAHENARRYTAIQEQMRTFWETGIATNPCGGVCNCTAGACGTLRP